MGVACGSDGVRWCTRARARATGGVAAAGGAGLRQGGEVVVMEMRVVACTRGGE
jgi:hypothetical protein